MGGNIFPAKGLQTPRMPRAIYHHMVQTCHAELRKLFRVVCTPVDGPAKPDFGDVDILVADPLQSPLEDGPAVWEQIVDALGAVDSLRKPQDNSAHLALPWPSLAAVPDSSQVSRGDVPQAKDDRFVQVDVRICTSEKALRWIAFRHAHGDIWSILGSTIRPLGLTADETALWLRIPEIEQIDKKRAKVFLTDDPHTTLEILGLPDDKQQWEAPFASYDDLFAYVAGGSYFFVSPHPPDDGDKHSGLQQQKLREELEAHGRPTAIHGDTRQSLKSNDRRRMNTRPLFRAWIDDFVPRCRAAGLYPPPPPPSPAGDGTTTAITKECLRDVLRDECLARFPDAAQEYGRRLTEWRIERHRLALVEAVKAAVPPDECAQLPGYDNSRGCSRSVVIAALRKIVLDEEADPDSTIGDGGSSSSRLLLGDFVPRRTADGLWLVEDAAMFATERWRDIAPVAWAASWKRIAEVMRLKNLKRKTELEAEATASDPPPANTIPMATAQEAMAGEAKEDKNKESLIKM